jgi:hypothetical protein
MNNSFRSLLTRSLAALALAACTLTSPSNVRANTLGEALDSPQFIWTTGGDAPWFYQTTVTSDGVDAAQSGALALPERESWVEVSVTGRVSVVYWWKLSSDPGWYTFYSVTNGQVDYSASGYGERDWRPSVTSFAEGTNTVRWRYWTPPTNPTNWAGNAAWLDRVQVTNITDLAPVFITQPPVTMTLSENYSFAPTNLTAVAIGDVPLTLQWQRNGEDLPGSYPIYDVNQATLTIYPQTQADTGGEYRLIASNAWGMATSVVCTVTMAPSPAYIASWTLPDTEVAPGEDFFFWAYAYGSLPFGWQWFKDGVLLTGETNQYLRMNPASAANDGVYQMVATNLYGAATSRLAQITISTDLPMVSGPWDEVAQRGSGDSVNFWVDATGPENLRYNWRKLGSSQPFGQEWNRDLFLEDLTATDSGLYRAIVTNMNGAVTSRVSVLAVDPVTPLAVALDVPQRQVDFDHWWSPWWPDVQGANAQDGLCAARSPQIGRWESASFSTTITGPTRVSFWWRISAADEAFLELDANGSIEASLSGQTGWQQQVLNLPAGEHILTWTFRKEDAEPVGDDAAWVDRLVIGSESAGTSHTLVAHYTFDDEFALGDDSSGHDNHISAGSSWGSPEHEYVPDAIAGPGAVMFYGNSSMAPPTNVLAALWGSFTVSAWIKTYQYEGNDDDDGTYGRAVVTAGVGYETDSTIPITLTGAKAAFWTGNPDPPYDDTLHSTSDVNTGDYVHIAVTRDQPTGEKRLYVNGVLEATSTGSTRPFSAATELFDLNIGGWPGYEGLLDDVQFYTGVLSDTQIASLYDNPGTTVPDDAGNTLGDALNAPELTWTTGGDASWFVQNTETHDGVSALQSGAIGDDQQSYVETQVAGPGQLSFWWKLSSELWSDYLSLEIDGAHEAGLHGEEDWATLSVDLGPGPHTVRWIYLKDSSGSDGSDAAWLDEVRFATPVEVSLNLEISRDANSPTDWFYVWPFIDVPTPDLITRHLLQSPNQMFQGSVGGEWSASSSILPTLDAVLAEITNGFWTLYINKDDPSEQQFTFTVSIAGLTTNEFGRVTIFSPTNGAVNVPATPTFHWDGPASLTTVFADVSRVGGGSGSSTNFTGVVSNWPSPPTLAAGTNDFTLNYYLWEFPDSVVSTPVNEASQPVAVWNPVTRLRSSARSRFVVGGGEGGALLQPQLGPGGLSFDFQTQTGRPHAIEAKTNLNDTAWQVLTNFTGDGNLWQFTFPATNPPTRFFRARTN